MGLPALPAPHSLDPPVTTCGIPGMWALSQAESQQQQQGQSQQTGTRQETVQEGSVPGSVPGCQTPPRVSGKLPRMAGACARGSRAARTPGAAAERRCGHWAGAQSCLSPSGGAVPHRRRCRSAPDNQMGSFTRRFMYHTLYTASQYQILFFLFVLFESPCVRETIF